MNKVILFDLDDTLINTHIIFTKEILKIKKYIAITTKVSLEEVSKFLDTTIVDTYQIAKVNPDKIWVITTEKLAQEYKLSQDIQKNIITKFFGIYKIRPKIRRGAKEILIRCRKEFDVGLVTHAQKKWTEFKLNSVGLNNYFKHIEIVDTDRAKNGNDWLKALYILNGDISRSWVVGDNIQGDIISAYSVGFKNLIWIDKEDGWKVYRSGKLPSKTHTIKDLSELNQIIFP